MISETRYQRNPDFIFRKIVDEIVLIPVYQDVANMDSIFTLNEMGALIWDHLAEPLTQTNLQAVILDEYEVDPQVLISDIGNFLGQMKEFGAIHEVV